MRSVTTALDKKLPGEMGFVVSQAEADRLGSTEFS
jgi:hypothetical protein